ncbi:MAG TPA: DUF5615 family PIN-like protein [Candidatus Acidoferrum sp.]|nr:DUF5615 family PIN-like protein [Candidatus Acidoferrum sp.]
MKFVVDNQLPVALVNWLVQNGWEAIHVLDLQLNTSSDTEIWSHARTNGFVVIAKDEDFSNRASMSPQVQVVWVPLGNCRNTALLATFNKQMSSIAVALKSGASVVEL